MDDLNSLLQSLPPQGPFDPATCTHANVDRMLDEDGNDAGWICRDCYAPFVPKVEADELRSELMEWQTAYINDGMAQTWRKRALAVRKELTALREATNVAYEALRFAWGGEPIGTLEREAMQKMGAALEAIQAAKWPTKP